MRAVSGLLLALAPLVLLNGCRFLAPGDDDARACTMEFRSYQVVVTDTLGQPTPDVIVDVRRASGHSIVCPIEGGTGCVRPGTERVLDEVDGRYTVIDDGVPVRRGGERFAVEAAKNDLKATAVLTFGHDGCHVSRIAGPDTLRLAR